MLHIRAHPATLSCPHAACVRYAQPVLLGRRWDTRDTAHTGKFVLGRCWWIQETCVQQSVCPVTVNQRRRMCSEGRPDVGLGRCHGFINFMPTLAIHLRAHNCPCVVLSRVFWPFGERVRAALRHFFDRM